MQRRVEVMDTGVDAECSGMEEGGMFGGWKEGKKRWARETRGLTAVG